MNTKFEKENEEKTLRDQSFITSQEGAGGSEKCGVSKLYPPPPTKKKIIITYFIKTKRSQFRFTPPPAAG